MDKPFSLNMRRRHKGTPDSAQAKARGSGGTCFLYFLRVARVHRFPKQFRDIKLWHFITIFGR